MAPRRRLVSDTKPIRIDLGKLGPRAMAASTALKRLMVMPRLRSLHITRLLEIGTPLEHRLHDLGIKIAHKTRRLVIVITIGISHAKCTHVQGVPSHALMIIHQVRKRACILESRSGRILDNKESLMVDLIAGYCRTELDNGHRLALLSDPVFGIVRILHDRPGTTVNRHKNEHRLLLLDD